MKTVVSKIISGGQTGADRAALDAAKLLCIRTGGYCPRGYKTETGYDKTLKHFKLKQTKTDIPAERTILNVKYSDGSVIFGSIFKKGEVLSPGTLLTLNKVNEFHKPYLLNPTKRELLKWIEKNKIKTLNVAGNKLSENPYIYKKVHEFILCTFGDNQLVKFRDVIDILANDNTSGSKTMLNKLITAVLKYLEKAKDVPANVFANILKATEPFTKGKNSEMMILHKFVKDLRNEIKINSKKDVRKFLKDYKNNLITESSRLTVAAINNIDFKYKTVLLLSNSSSITSVFKELLKRRIPVNVIQCKSYPGGEGLIQSDVLKSYGLKVRLINDNEVKRYLPKTDFALFGCDAYNKKYFLNKAGSFVVSKIFHSAKKPVYVLADRRKYSAGFHKRQNLSGMFDMIPLSYATKIILSE